MTGPYGDDSRLTVQELRESAAEHANAGRHVAADLLTKEADEMDARLAEEEAR